jgi:hypothetical protein
MGGCLDFHFKNVYFATGASVLCFACLFVCLLEGFFVIGYFAFIPTTTKKEEKNSTNSHDKTHGETIWT